MDLRPKSSRTCKTALMNQLEYPEMQPNLSLPSPANPHKFLAIAGHVAPTSPGERRLPVLQHQWLTPIGDHHNCNFRKIDRRYSLPDLSDTLQINIYQTA